MTAWDEFWRTLGLLWRILLDGLTLVTAPVTSGSASVCIVRVDGIGDFVLWIDACRRLSARYRGAGLRVVLVANAIWAPWARELELVDEVWEFDRVRFAQDFGYRAGWIRKMHASGFGTVLQPAHSRRPAEGDSLVRASGAPQRIGSAGDCANSVAWLKQWADRWYTELINCGGTQRMELLRNADFMRGLGFADFRARLPELGANPAKNPVGLARKSYAVLIPGAGAELRAWPIASFAETGRRLAARGLGLVLAGAAGDRPAAQALLRELPPGVEDFTGQTRLGELAAILADARLVVSNETGAAHIAAAVGSPVVCVMGGGHYGRFMPYELEESPDRQFLLVPVARKMDCFGCGWKCIYARAPGEPVKCIKDVTMEQLWPQVIACLAQADAGGAYS
jgi:ADP-heptose:LPS heptosyltransferase